MDLKSSARARTRTHTHTHTHIHTHTTHTHNMHLHICSNIGREQFRSAISDLKTSKIYKKWQVNSSLLTFPLPTLCMSEMTSSKNTKTIILKQCAFVYDLGTGVNAQWTGTVTSRQIFSTNRTERNTSFLDNEIQLCTITMKIKSALKERKRLTNRQADRHRQRETDTETEQDLRQRQTNRQTDTDRETDRQRDRARSNVHIMYQSFMTEKDKYTL